MVKISNPTMFSDFETNGVWSFTKNMENTYSGTLLYDAKNGLFTITLYSNKTFECFDKDSILYKNPNNFSLYGISDKHEAIHLIDCHINQKITSELWIIKIRSSYAIFGKDFFTNLTQNVIDKVSFGFYGLNEWLQLPIWKGDLSQKINQKIPNLKEYQLTNFDAILKENIAYINSSTSNKLEASSELFYTLIFNTPQTIEDIRYKVNIIVHFFFFLFSSNVPIKFIEFQTSDFSNQLTTDLKSIKIPNQYRVYYSQINSQNDKRFRKDRKINYNTVSNNLENIFNNWVNQYENFTPIIQTFVGDLQLSSFAEIAFLNACRNVEVLHRIKFDNLRKEQSNEIECAREELLDSLNKYPKEVKDFFEPKINHDDGTTLNKRIKELINCLPKDISERIISFEGKNFSESKKRFIRSVSNTRNFITHGNSNKDTYYPMFEGFNLVLSSRILNLITEFFILTDIGIEENLVIMDLFNNDHYWIIYNHPLKL